MEPIKNPKIWPPEKITNMERIVGTPSTSKGAYGALVTVIENAVYRITTDKGVYDIGDYQIFEKKIPAKGYSIKSDKIRTAMYWIFRER
ncbi:MAG: hypothetical protein FWF97_03290 [Alphaproteobacteria bacterium]|nr:hypothetical protein [Alphaproteobacteria bacterium]